MNNQLLQLRIEEAKANKKESEFKIKIVRILHEIITLSNPFFDEIEDIKAAQIEQAADELLTVTKLALENQKKLKEIKKELGE